MYLLLGTEDDRYLEPGSRVRLSIKIEDNGLVSPQSGIVIHCWRDEEADCFMSYVAFFGDDLPQGRPTCEPYVLQHKATSLALLPEGEMFRHRTR